MLRPTLGRLNPASNAVTIIGGGFSGLVAACILSRRGMQVTLHEASERLGGLIRTDVTPWGISEWAAHSILATQSVESFLSSLNVPYVTVNSGSGSRMIFRSGKNRKFPLSFLEVIVALVRISFIRSQKTGLTVAEWAERHLGHAVTEVLICPMVNGIFASHPAALSVEAAFPDWAVPPGKTLLGHLFDYFKNKKKKGHTSRILTPLGGMGQWMSAMERELQVAGVQVYLKSCVQDLSSLSQSENIIVALPAPAAAVLLSGHAPRLSARLQAVRYASLVTATVFVEEGAFARIPCGVGTLVSGNESVPCLGVLLNSSTFMGRAAEGVVSLTLFFRGGDAMFESDVQIETRTKKSLQILFGLHGPVLGCVVHRQDQAIPLYDADLIQTWECAQTSWCAEPGRILIGSFAGQVSLRGMIQQLFAL